MPLALAVPATVGVALILVLTLLALQPARTPPTVHTDGSRPAAPSPSSTSSSTESASSPPSSPPSSSEPDARPPAEREPDQESDPPPSIPTRPTDTVQIRESTVPTSGSTTTTSGAPSMPTSVSDCTAGGWVRFVDDQGEPFANQGHCVAFVTRQSP